MSILDYIKDMFRHPAKYNKFWMSLLAPLSTLMFVLAPLESDPAFHVSAGEWYQVLVSGVAPLGVVSIANRKT